MSTEIVTRVVTVNFQEETLTEINELAIISPAQDLLLC